MNPSRSARAGIAATTAETLFVGATVPFRVRTPCAKARHAIEHQYAHLESTPTDAPLPGEPLTIDVVPASGGGEEYEFTLDGAAAMTAHGTGHLLHELDNHLAYELQCRAPELYFVHAACLARGDRGTIIMGESGAGKSTTAFALCSLGMRYLSDELAPIEPRTRTVLPYARALCLKNPPPPPLVLPDEGTLATEWTLHVAAEAIGAEVAARPTHLERIIFLVSAPTGTPAALRPLAKSEAAMRLYQNALNQLAHSSWGLDDTLRLVADRECYELRRGDVAGTLAALREVGVA